MDIRRLLIGLWLCLTASCTNDPTPTAPMPEPPPDPALSDTRPVDMLYTATVMLGETDCAFDNGAPLISMAYINAYLQSDGNLSLGIDGQFVPGPYTYEHVTRTGSRIDHTKVETDQSGKFIQRISGILDPDHVELSIKAQYYGDGRDEAGNYKRCTRTATIKGAARPLSDPNMLDGRFNASVLGLYSCSDGREHIRGIGDMPIEVKDTFLSEYVSFSINDSQRYTFALRRDQMSGNDPATDLDMYIDTLREPHTVIGKVRGTFTPQKLDIHITYRPSETYEGCWEEFIVKGNKVIPSLERIENRYRTHSSYTLECEDGVYESDGSIEIVRTSEGYTLIGGEVSVPLTMRGENFTAETYFEDGSLFTFKGTLKPGEVAYEIVATHPPGPNALCTEHLHVTGKPRFVFP